MVAGRFRQQGGKLLDIDFVNVRRAAEPFLSHIFQAGSYAPDCIEEQFPQVGWREATRVDGALTPPARHAEEAPHFYALRMILLT
jgi:hypothetical protein